MRDNGLARFKKRLAKVPAAIRREVSKAIEKNAVEWVATAKSLAPDDPSTPNNDLRSSIRHYATETGGQVVRAGGETTMRDGYDYAIGQEFGTQEMPAHPYFWPSYRLLRKRFDSRRRRAVNKAVKDFNHV